MGKYSPAHDRQQTMSSLISLFGVSLNEVTKLNTHKSKDRVFVVNLEKIENKNNSYVIRGYTNDYGQEIPAVQVFDANNPALRDSFDYNTDQLYYMCVEALNKSLGDFKKGEELAYISTEFVTKQFGGLTRKVPSPVIWLRNCNLPQVKLYMSRHIPYIDEEGNYAIKTVNKTIEGIAVADKNGNDVHYLISKVVTNDYIRGIVTLPKSTIFGDDKSLLIDFVKAIKKSDKEIADSSSTNASNTTDDGKFDIMC